MFGIDGCCGFIIVGLFGDKLIVGIGVGVGLVIMLLFIGFWCVMLKVLVFWVLDIVGVVSFMVVLVIIFLLFFMVMFWIFMVGWILVVLDILVLGVLFDVIFLVFILFDLVVVECWWWIDGCWWDWVVVVSMVVGCMVGEWICGGGSGVVGDVGWDVKGGWVNGSGMILIKWFVFCVGLINLLVVFIDGMDGVRIMLGVRVIGGWVLCVLFVWWWWGWCFVKGVWLVGGVIWNCGVVGVVLELDCMIVVEGLVNGVDMLIDGGGVCFLKVFNVLDFDEKLEDLCVWLLLLIWWWWWWFLCLVFLVFVCMFLMILM